MFLSSVRKFEATHEQYPPALAGNLRLQRRMRMTLRTCSVAVNFMMRSPDEMLIIYTGWAFVQANRIGCDSRYQSAVAWWVANQEPVTMLLLEELLTPLATLLHLPVGITIFATLMLLGAVGHYTIYHVVRRLTTAADHTDTRWDDVILYAIFPPIQWVMWVVFCCRSAFFRCSTGFVKRSCAYRIRRYSFCLAGSHTALVKA